MGVLDLVAVLMKRWRVLTALPLGSAALLLGISLVVLPTYTATTTFVPEAPSTDELSAGASGLAGLAQQFGVTLGGSSSQSPQFYAQLAMSREILDRLLNARHRDPRNDANRGDSTTLLTLMDAGGSTLSDSLERASKKLAHVISLGVDGETSIVTVKVHLRWANLAASVARQLVDDLNEFNTRTRQSQARQRREFIEQRVASGAEALHQAEDSLERFYEANRTWQQSPQLITKEGALRRQVDLQQELYVTLRREYEEARIDEVNDTPVITVIDTASVPQRRSSPRRTLWAILGMVLGVIGGILYALAREYLDRLRREHGQMYAALAYSAGQARREMRDVFGGVFLRLRGAPRSRSDS